MELHQTKKFCIAKEIINKMKRQPMKWKKIFANHISIKGLISKIYKEHIKINTKKKKKKPPKQKKIISKNDKALE